MNKDAIKENQLTLQKLLGLNKDASQKILGSAVLITIKGNHSRLVEFLEKILSKTFEIVHTVPDPNVNYSCEILSDSSYRISEGPYIFLGQKGKEKLTVSLHPLTEALEENTHPFLYFLLACYTGGMVLRKIASALPIKTNDEIVINIAQLINNKGILSSEINIGTAYLAGAGAIGNSFLYALTTFQVQGELNVVDPDFVSGGNINRCLLFVDGDVGQNKVDVLVNRAQPYFNKLKLVPLPCELSKVPDKFSGAWLEKLIVGVDSRRARRNLQGEIPKEVFDASTTGIEEVVIHHHKRPLKGACLGCIYAKEKQEEAHEVHIAESLGVSLDHVKKQFIDNEAAELITKKYSIDKNEVLGIPYDTLFKKLCGEGKLMTSKNNQVLAPLAFVSALAGALLALMLVEKHLEITDYNYWRVSPWTNLVFQLQQKLETNPNCEFCNDQVFSSVSESLWGKIN